MPSFDAEAPQHAGEDLGPKNPVLWFCKFIKVMNASAVAGTLITGPLVMDAMTRVPWPRFPPNHGSAPCRCSRPFRREANAAFLGLL